MKVCNLCQLSVSTELLVAKSLFFVPHCAFQHFSEEGKGGGGFPLKGISAVFRMNMVRGCCIFYFGHILQA